MKMENEIKRRIDLARLIAAKKTGVITESELKELDILLSQNPDYKEIYDSLMNSETLPNCDISERVMWKKFNKRYNLRQNNLYIYRRIAAILLIFLSIAAVTSLLYYKLSAPDKYAGNVSVTFETPQKEDKAMLILDNGEKIVINTTEQVFDASKKSLAAMIPFKKTTPSKDKTTTDQVVNTIVVPDYGKLTIRMSDNSLVTINAGSTLKYPEEFNGNTREVWLNGEAYFEVNVDKQRRFIVHTEKADVLVFGTSFNVNAYQEYNEMKATLISGSVKVNSKGGSVDLLPGQQAILNGGSNDISVLSVDVNESLSWIYDKFYFAERELNDIVKQLSMWYKVEISFDNDELKHRRFTLEAKKYDNIQNILELLKETGVVEFTISNDKILIHK